MIPRLFAREERLTLAIFHTQSAVEMTLVSFSDFVGFFKRETSSIMFCCLTA
jgi:hypothetical protein